MKWNRWPYWVRGGVLGALISFCVSALSVYGGSSIVGTIATIFFLLMAFPLLLLFQDFIPQDFRTVVILTSIYFILGTILGWLYGKMKKSEASSPKP